MCIYPGYKLLGRGKGAKKKQGTEMFLKANKCEHTDERSKSRFSEENEDRKIV